jgi:Mg2+ and Co2+ transporter CorA
MDSMVDVFMPLIDFIEDEADEIDSRIVHHDTQGSSPLAALADAEDAFVQEERRRLSEEEAEREKAAARASSASGDGSSGSSDDFVRKQKEAGLEAHELQSHPRRPSSARADDSSPNQDLSTRTTLAAWIQGQSHWFKIEKGDFIFVRRTVLAFYPLIARTLIILSLHPAQRQARKLRREAKRGPKLNFHDFDRKLMLKRMVGMRRLVTGLNRLLVTKNEVVGRLRKRAADMRRSSPRSATDLSEQMSTYFGDIQGAFASLPASAGCDRLLWSFPFSQITSSRCSKPSLTASMSWLPRNLRTCPSWASPPVRRETVLNLPSSPSPSSPSVSCLSKSFSVRPFPSSANSFIGHLL